MSSGQMMLVIGAFTIFSVMRLNFQQASLESAMYLDSNTYLQNSIGIARSMLNEIQARPFDAACVTKKIVYLNDLTSCGAGTGEKYPNLNDLDDFHNQTFTSRMITDTSTNVSSTPPCLRNLEGYRVSCQVTYVTPSSPTTATTTRTFSKRVSLTISNRFSDHVYTASTVVSY